MGNWKSSLNSDPTDWLLEDSNPSVRYFTLKWILDINDADSDVMAACAAISQPAYGQGSTK